MAAAAAADWVAAAAVEAEVAAVGRRVEAAVDPEGVVGWEYSVGVQVVAEALAVAAGLSDSTAAAKAERASVAVDCTRRAQPRAAPG